MKYIVVTGGVMSGIGKGITASSLGVLLQFYGFTVTAIKIDPYFNIDAGTMSPFEHGECYVLADGGECDLDLGNYERFLDITLTKDHNITSGKINQKVTTRERMGQYLGQTVQVIPHVTDEIKTWIKQTATIPVNANGDKPDICIIELGGTIGDIEGMPFIEALGQMAYEAKGDGDRMCVIHVAYVPVLRTHDGKSMEPKTKPTQNSVKELRRLGINPDIICVRCEHEISDKCIKKLSSRCHVPIQNVILNPNKKNIYQIPALFEKQNVFNMLSPKLQLSGKLIASSHVEWQNIIHNFEQPDNICKIGIVGKYTGLLDSYLSLLHGIKHAAYFLSTKPEITFIESDNITDKTIKDKLKDLNGIIIPGGFGVRGITGMLLASKYARENNIPMLGICLGMQIQIIDVGRHSLNADCNSTEFEAFTPCPVVTVINKNIKKMGGTMKLGSHKTKLINENATCYQLYTKYGMVDACKNISERHRHRYEVNPEYLNYYMDAGLSVVGIQHDNTQSKEKIADMIELQKHPYFVGCQFHPEYNTHHNRPHPLFIGLIQATITHKKEICDNNITFNTDK